MGDWRKTKQEIDKIITYEFLLEDIKYFMFGNMI